MRIRALERSCPAILPTATGLSSYNSVTVPHLGEALSFGTRPGKLSKGLRACLALAGRT
jgi:hypothetical protein